jgi:hypothetical protein
MSELETILGEDGQIKPEIVERAKGLIANIAELVKGEEPAVVLFVLEAALTEQIAMYAPPLGELFRSMMKAYKHKAAALISIVEMIKNSGVSLEELMQEARDGQGDINPDEKQGLRGSREDGEFEPL